MLNANYYDQSDGNNKETRNLELGLFPNINSVSVLDLQMGRKTPQVK